MMSVASYSFIFFFFIYPMQFREKYALTQSPPQLLTSWKDRTVYCATKEVSQYTYLPHEFEKCVWHGSTDIEQK